MDLFTGDQVILPENQVHDLNPGILENGLFWVVRIPDASVDANPGAGRARMLVKDLEVEDYGNLENALLDGPSVPATVSFDCRWFAPTAITRYRNAAVDQQFVAQFRETTAGVEWSVKEEGFEFTSDAAATSVPVIAEVGHERNGAFFS
jgi:hypothetical protein